MADWRIILALAGAVVPACSSAATVPVSVSQRESWADYWTRFARAARAGDAAGIAAASAPSVMQHGVLDGGPVVKLPRAKVPAAVARLIRDPQPIDARRRPLRDALAGPAPVRGADEPLGHRRLGPLVFQQIRGRWFLSEIYIEE